LAHCTWRLFLRFKY